MPITRPALHSIDAGLDLAARSLILERLGESADMALNRFVSVEAMLDIQELDSKLSEVYDWSEKHSWLKRSEAVLLTLARKSGVRPESPDAPFSLLGDLPWTAFVSVHAGRARILSMPDAEFLAVLELSLRDQLHTGPEGRSRVRRMASIFRRRRLPYAVADDGDISWVGEPEIARRAIAPALTALEDERLSNARVEFSEARSELRADRFDDAVNDAGKAVETTMACLLTAYGHDLPRNKEGVETIQANRLLDSLKQHSLIESRAKPLLMASHQFCHAGSHGAGPRPRPVERSDAEAAVASAAVAISYLARRLPPPSAEPLQLDS